LRWSFAKWEQLGNAVARSARHQALAFRRLLAPLVRAALAVRHRLPAQAAHLAARAVHLVLLRHLLVVLPVALEFAAACVFIAGMDQCGLRLKCLIALK
jgi:hypothetical protein